MTKEDFEKFISEEGVPVSDTQTYVREGLSNKRKMI